MDVQKFPTVVMGMFDVHSEAELLSLKFHLLDHVEDLDQFVRLHFVEQLHT